MNGSIHNRPVYIVDGARTPFLKARGTPGPFSAGDLAVGAGRPLLARRTAAAQHIDQVILGCVAPNPDEVNIARVVALRLGLSERIPAWTVQRNCASGLQAVASAAAEIASGRAGLILAGGTEAMSHSPVLWSRAMVEWLGRLQQIHSPMARGRHLLRLRPAHLTPVIALMRGLIDPIAGISMGQTAEHLAWRFDIGREAMDAFALRSHRLLGTARVRGVFGAEIEPLFDTLGHSYTEDDGFRADSDMARLTRLKPVFDRPNGSVTAGNSAQVSDGAAMLLLASEETAERHDLPVLARIHDLHWAALDPVEMGLGPIHAMAPLLRNNQLTIEDLDIIEINEAFAAQVLACQRALQDPVYREQELGLQSTVEAIPDDKLNPEGGAIALGHPVGASGARLVLHLALSLRQRGLKRGAASLCIGGGQGGAILIER